MFVALTLTNGGYALVNKNDISCMSASKSGFKIYMKGDSVPFELSPKSFASLQSILSDSIIDCQ